MTEYFDKVKSYTYNRASCDIEIEQQTANFLRLMQFIGNRQDSMDEWKRQEKSKFIRNLITYWYKIVPNSINK